MKLQFYKYQGTGNDFIMIDNRENLFDSTNSELIARLCNRKFGIGADGLICINSSDKLSFEVDYSNADGSKSFCGNGARCSVAFAKQLDIIHSEAIFSAIDGDHEAKFIGNNIAVKMQNVNSINHIEKNAYTLNTGSPHYVKFIEEEEIIDIVNFGKNIRYSEDYISDGINVNTAKQISENVIYVETYERGVEDETLSCGTGVTAVALSYAIKKNLQGKNEIKIHTKGGNLSVEFIREEIFFSEIWLIGPAINTFNGTVEI